MSGAVTVTLQLGGDKARTKANMLRTAEWKDEKVLVPEDWPSCGANAGTVYFWRKYPSSSSHSLSSSLLLSNKINQTKRQGLVRCRVCNKEEFKFCSEGSALETEKKVPVTKIKLQHKRFASWGWGVRRRGGGGERGGGGGGGGGREISGRGGAPAER